MRSFGWRATVRDLVADVEITFEGKRYTKREGDSVLDALLRGGADVPFSCRKGTCHTCLLQCKSGEVDTAAQRGLSSPMQDAGLFKACVAREIKAVQEAEAVHVQRPDGALWVAGAMVQDVEQVAPTVYKLSLETAFGVKWRAGQFVNVRGPGGAWRSFSIGSVRDADYFMELHVRLWPGGKVSQWIATELHRDMAVEFRGPFGSCVYDKDMAERPLLLIGTGVGMAPLLGVAREALGAGHAAGVHVFYGVRSSEDAYLVSALRALEQKHETLHVTLCVSGDGAGPGVFAGRAVDAAFAAHAALAQWEVFLCGNPDAVHAARARALDAGAADGHIHADPFESSTEA